MIHRVIYRTATVTDVGDCLIAARAGLAWIQAVPEASDDCRSVVEKFVELKPKQARITACVVQGMKNKQIAAQLGTTQQVIKNYLVDIYHQLGTNTREEVIRYFLESPLACEHASIDFRVFKM
jgi:DNA-binding NarL/FixJ family response regulator